MEEDRVMKTMGPLKAADDDVQCGGGTFGHWLHQVLCRKGGGVSVRVPVVCGTGLGNKIHIAGFTPAGAQLSCMHLVHALHFLMWC